MKRFIIASFFIFIAITSFSSDVGAIETIGLSSFPKIANLEIFTNEIPLVAKVRLPDIDPDRGTWAVWEADGQKFIASSIYKKVVDVITPKVQIVNDSGSTETSKLVDDDVLTHIDLPIENGSKATKLFFSFPSVVFVDKLDIAFAKYSSVPQKISISVATDDTSQKLIADKIDFFGNEVKFPIINGTNWWVTLYHDQPLRIAEMSFSDSQNTKYEKYLQFLALKNTKYQVVHTPYDLDLSFLELPDFTAATQYLHLTLPSLVVNSQYVASDKDNDSITDESDNCPNLANLDQLDKNKNLVGDACEDFDLDGWKNASDNCPDITNKNQIDTDKDGKGDACDGFESRWIERQTWLPWVGIGFGFIIVIVMTVLTTKKQELS